MQAGTAATPQRKLDSSPPSATPQEGDGTVHSAERSPTLNTPSSTRTLVQFSSPELPPLPSLRNLGAVQQELAGTSSQTTSDDNYFTASWGSPYPYTPNHSALPPIRRERTWADSSDNIENESPDPNFGLGHLLPTRLGLFHQLSPTRPPTPASDRSSEYIGALADSFDASGPLQLHLVKDSPLRSRARRGHFPSDSTLTVKPDDFLQLHDQPSNMQQSRYAAPAVSKPEKELPSLPKESPNEELATPGTIDPVSPSHPMMHRKSSSISASLSQRPKRKVVYKSKTCVIGLPIDPPRGGDGNAPIPLTNEEVQARLDGFSKLGYDVRGFGHWMGSEEPFDSEHQAQNREIHPDPTEQLEVQRDKSYRVRLPDTKEWDQEENSKVEAALRELGVSGPDGHEEVENPMSRQASSHISSNPFSPPVRAASVGSQPFPPMGSFPAGFTASAPTSHAASIASPVSSMANVRTSAHAHRQSTFSPPLQQMIAPPGLGGWSSPQPLPNPQVLSSGGSPSLASTRPDIATMQSPILPVQPQPAQQFSFAERDELVAKMHRQQQQQLQLALQRQQEQQLLAARPPSTLQEVPEVEEASVIQPQPTLVRSGDAPEVVHPKPIHRHNISAQLEQDAENGHYRLEQSLNKDIDEENANDPDQSDLALGGPSPSDLPLRISSLQKQLEASDVETNPSDLDNVQRFSNTNGTHPAPPNKLTRSWTDESAFSPIDPQEPLKSHRHAPKFSVAGLNVDAKEFKPGGSVPFNPSSYPATTFSFHPQPQAQPFIPKSFNPANTSARSSSVTSPGDSSFNPAAAPFSPIGFGRFGLSESGKFSFSADGPSFKSAADNFSPSSPGFSDNSLGSSANSNSIFGKFNSSNVIKPAKTSRAVPIMAPKQPSPEIEAKEDEDGRIIQDDSRFKRARRRDSEGDQVPQFAGPYSADARPVEAVRQDTMSTQIDESAVSDLADDDVQDTSLLTQSTTADLVENEQETGRSSLSHIFVSDNPDKIVDEPSMQSDDEARLLPLNDQVDSRKSSPTKRKAHQRSLSALAAEFQPRVLSEIDPDLNPYAGSYDVNESQIIQRIVSPPLSQRSSSTDVEPNEDERRGNMLEATPQSQRVPSSVRYYDDQDEAEYRPTFEEIDYVMKHFDEEGSEGGVVREAPSWPASSPGGQTARTPGRLAEYQRSLEAKLRSDAPSPSPRRPFPQAPLEGDSDPFSDGRALASPPAEEEEARPEGIISDWDDAVSSGRTEQFEDRSAFFDRRVSSLIDNAVRNQLGPLEKYLHSISSKLAELDRSSPRRRTRSQTAADSDADDEEDEAELDAQSSGWSPRRNGKFDKFRAIVQDAIASHQQSALDIHDLNDVLAEIRTTLTAVSSLNAEDLHHAVASIKASVDHSVSQVLRLDDIQSVVEETVARQNSALIEQREQATRLTNSYHFAEFSDSLKQAAVRLAEETEARKLAEKRLDETDRLLKLTEEELTMFKESSRDVGQAATQIADRVHKATVRAEEAEAKAAEAQTELKDLQEDLSRATTKNSALVATLEEYRLSHDKWRRDIDKAYQDREAVMQTFTALRLQAEESIRLRESMRTRIEKLHSDMSDAAAQVASERAQWQKKEMEHLTRVEVISARAEAEARTRERFEREMERLEIQEREAMRLRSAFEQAKKDNAALEETVRVLKNENAEHQKTAEQYGREFREAREAGRLEVERTRRLLETDIEAANHEVNIVRAELEAEIARVRNELDHVRIDADTSKAKHELDLEQAEDMKRDALHEAHHDKATALEDQKMAFEERLEELRKRHRRDLDDTIENKNQAETFLKETHMQRVHGITEQHRRELEQIVEGKMQTEKFLNDRLELADEKIVYLQDRVLLLEEKLEVAKTAAHAAAAAARSGKMPALERPISPVVSRGPEKHNTQALRETIAVLQDQLQERETRIETLEQEISELDKDAPNKLKAKDTEIGWLRELLGVRLDDLSDLVNALSHPEFDRESVRNAAIRIRTGLQMEQHDKERQMAGSPQFPTLATISNFASPRAAQLAAAWGNWRKGRDLIPSSLSQSVQSLAGGSESRDVTPSKPSISAQNFVTGLMTPPTSNLRPSPEPESGSSKTANGSIGRSLSNDLRLSSRAQEKMPLAHEPTTPPLLHKSSYDSDAVADDGDYSTAGYYDDDESTVDGTPRGVRRDSSIAGSTQGTPKVTRRGSSFGGSTHSMSPRAHRRGSFGPSMM